MANPRSLKVAQSFNSVGGECHPRPFRLTQWYTSADCQFVLTPCVPQWSPSQCRHTCRGNCGSTNANRMVFLHPCLWPCHCLLPECDILWHCAHALDTDRYWAVTGCRAGLQSTIQHSTSCTSSPSPRARHQVLPPTLQAMKRVRHGSSCCS